MEQPFISILIDIAEQKCLVNPTSDLGMMITMTITTALFNKVSSSSESSAELSFEARQPDYVSSCFLFLPNNCYNISFKRSMGKKCGYVRFY